jgi:hypothetical protein
MADTCTCPATSDFCSVPATTMSAAEAEGGGRRSPLFAFPRRRRSNLNGQRHQPEAPTSASTRTAQRPAERSFSIRQRRRTNTTPGIAAAGSGFVAVWSDQSQSGSDASGVAVRGQWFDASGGKQGSEFLVNTTTAGPQPEPEIASLLGGRVVVVWTDYSQTGGDTDTTAIRAQIFQAGSKQGSEILVNSIPGARRTPPPSWGSGTEGSWWRGATAATRPATRTPGSTPRSSTPTARSPARSSWSTPRARAGRARRPSACSVMGASWLPGPPALHRRQGAVGNGRPFAFGRGAAALVCRRSSAASAIEADGEIHTRQRR